MKLPKLYHITFHDHTCGTDEPLTCHVVGWLLKKTKKFITITSWVVDDVEAFENNLEKVCIVRSCILKMEEIPVD